MNTNIFYSKYFVNEEKNLLIKHFHYEILSKIVIIMHKGFQVPNYEISRNSHLNTIQKLFARLRIFNFILIYKIFRSKNHLTL